MPPIRRILVAVKDPAAKPLTAVRKGAQLAHAYGAHLELFHGITTPLFVDGYSLQNSLAGIETKLRAASVRQLEKIASTLRRGGLEVSVSVTWDYPVYEAIVRHSRRSNADLIVAERHAGPHVLPGMLQLTDWELLRTSPVPVLLVKTASPYNNPVVLAAIDPTHACAKPAKLDDEILATGAGIARALDGQLHAVHAYIPLRPESLSGQLVTEKTLQRKEAETRVAAKRSMDRTVGSVPIPPGRRHLVGLHPIDAIEQTARKIHSDIVVMGAISRSGLKRFIFGNTAEALLDSLSCDLLIVKPMSFVSRVQKQARGIRYTAMPYVPGC